MGQTNTFCRWELLTHRFFFVSATFDLQHTQKIPAGNWFLWGCIDKEGSNNGLPLLLRNPTAGVASLLFFITNHHSPHKRVHGLVDIELSPLLTHTEGSFVSKVPQEVLNPAIDLCLFHGSELNRNRGSPFVLAPHPHQSFFA
jgi:hypothetical protein